MEVINKIKIDLLRAGVKPIINAMQADENSRVLEITLNANGDAWEIPTGVSFSVAYKKPDGTRGLYDTMPDGTSASYVDGNVVSIRLAPQMLTAPGTVNTSVVISSGDQRISTFPIIVNVIQNPAVGAVGSEDYFYSSAIGNLDDLKTTNKSSLVAAINEIFSTGGSGSNSGQNPDWNQNDPDAPDYVKNRTHWEEGNQTVIEWDGNTEGLESVPLGGTPYYKISDLTPSLDELKGVIFEGVIDGASDTFTFTEEEWGQIVELNSQYCVNLTFLGNPCVIAYNTNANLQGIEIEFPSTGIWAFRDLRKMTYGTNTIHTLDEKFIPDTIARKIANEITLVSPSGTPFDITVSDDGVLSVNGTPISGGEVLTDAEEVAF